MIIKSKNYNFSLPEDWQDKIFSYLSKQEKFSHKPKKWSKWILDVSDNYLKQTPHRHQIWDKTESCWAYLIYFLPLNYLRIQYVLQEIQDLGILKDITSIVDFGSGCGTTELAFSQTKSFNSMDFINIEINQNAQNIHRELNQIFKVKSQSLFLENISQVKHSKNNLLFCSYSLNEIDEFPTWIKNFETLVFIEPSMHNLARKLMKFKDELIEKDYKVLAPCTHSKPCPLLLNSKKDWCHQSIHFDQASWWKTIESYLPIKNKKLSFTYLILSKTEVSTKNNNLTRVIGDPLKEKGKTKQLICKSSNREFLSWLKKDPLNKKLQRGDLIEIPDTLELKGNEIRFNNNSTK